MSQELEVKVKGQDEALPHRVLEIKLDTAHHMNTPMRAMDARRASEHPDASPAETRFFEYYSRSSAATIDARMHQKDKELKYGYELGAIRKVAKAAPLLMLSEYYEASYPSDPQLQFIIRTVHAYSDFVTLPLVSRVTDRMDADTGFEGYLSFLKRALAIVDTYNRKPIMGVIPLKVPFIRIQELVKFYTDRGIHALCVDFSASKPDTAVQSIEQILFSLAAEGAIDTTYLHAINVNPGRPKTATPVSNCHSILSYGYGMDSFGDLHRTRMKIQNPPGLPPVLRKPPPRLFSRGDYGDHAVRAASDLQAIQPPATGISLANCLNSKGLAKIFNAEQHSMEATLIGSMLLGKDEPRHEDEKAKEEASKAQPPAAQKSVDDMEGSGIGDYLQQKEYVDGRDLKLIRNLGQGLHKKTKR